jgi:hypothetical protein
LVDLQTAVRYLAAALNRPIERSGNYIVQRCAICDVELRMWDTEIPSYTALFRRLFAFYDAHQCFGYGCSVEEAYQRAELASVRLAESALELQQRERSEQPGDLPSLYERAERESLVLATAAGEFEKRLRR